MQIVDDAELQNALDKAADRLADTTPLMRSLSLGLLDNVEENFNVQGRPKWQGLNPQYAAQRKGSTILQVTGQLAASITPFFSADAAGVGTNKIYAAILHFGGKTRAHTIRPKHKQALAFNGGVFKQVQHPGSKIPARPYMGMDEYGVLQPETRETVFEIIDIYLKKSF